MYVTRALRLNWQLVATSLVVRLRDQEPDLPGLGLLGPGHF
jgi:hypothetical protein